MNAKRDENFVTSVLGVDGNGNVVVIEADGSTSRLLLDITPVADTSPLRSPVPTMVIMCPFQ